MSEENSTSSACEVGPVRSSPRESRDRRKRHRRGKKRYSGGAAGRPAGAAPPAAAVAAHPLDLHSSKSGGERGQTDEDSLESGSEVYLLGSLSPPPYRVDDRCQQPPQPTLRPVVVPKAPENSTQFLIDDHEDSTLFLNFEDSYKSPSWCGPCADPDSFFLSDPDEDSEESFSHMYYMRDFESEYQSAREEVLLSWSREMLFEEIQKLEKKARSLEELLNLRDPQKYLASLQERLINLQEENRQLQAALSRSDRSSSAATSEDDVEPYRRERADTASDLVMVVAPLSLQDTHHGLNSHQISVAEMETT